MIQSTSLTRQSAPQRKATVLRRVFGTLALVGMLALSQTADAQSRGQRGDRGDRTEQRIERMTADLDLSGAQATQLRALFEAEKANRPARGERGTSQRGERGASQRGDGDRQARRAEMDRQIEALLRPEQAERFRAMKAEREQQRGQRGQRGGTR